jgi:hypothetical protein
LPLYSSFHFTCFCFFFALSKRFLGCSRQNFWCLRFCLALLLPTEAFGNGLIACMQVQGVLSSSSCIIRCSWRGRCRQTRTADTSGRVSSWMFVFIPFQILIRCLIFASELIWLKIFIGWDIWPVMVGSNSCEGVFSLANCCCIRTLGRPPSAHSWPLLAYLTKLSPTGTRFISTAPNYEVADGMNHTVHCLIVCFLVLLHDPASKLI